MNAYTPINNDTPLIEVVTRAQRGDRAAFGELFVRFEKHVYAIALRRLRNHSEAQELTQDVFIQVMRKLAQLRDPASFAGWLRSITQRLAINRVVRRKPGRAIESEALEAVCIERITPLDRAIDSEEGVRVRGGLSELRDLDRETHEAFYLHGQSLNEMSDSFEAPVGTIKRRLHVARKRLAAKVDELCAC
jgi:RNA polymerase sigma-70 factor (ECF subfamily)